MHVPIKFVFLPTQVRLKSSIKMSEMIKYLFLDSSARSSSLQIPHYENDDGDPNAADISSGSTSSTNHRFFPRVSRL